MDNYFTIGEDLGYSTLKCANENNKQTIIPAIIARGHKRKSQIIQNANNMFLNSRNNDDPLSNLHLLIRENGIESEFFAGKLAESKPNATHIPSHNKINSLENKVLIALGAALLIPENNTKPVHLVTGLPIGQYEEQEKDLKNYLENFTCDVEIKNLNIKKNIKFDRITILQQGLSGLYFAIWDDFKKYMKPNSYLAVIDWGFKTIDFAVFYIDTNGKIIFMEEFSDSIENNGMIELEKQVNDMFKIDNKEDLTLVDLKTLIKNKTIFFQGKDLDYSKQIEEIKEDLARTAKNNILAKWNPILNRISCNFLIGGGNIAQYNYMKDMTINTKLSKQAQLANVLAYIKLGKTQEYIEKNK